MRREAWFFLKARDAIRGEGTSLLHYPELCGGEIDGFARELGGREKECERRGLAMAYHLDESKP